MESRSNEIGVALLSAVFILGGCILIIGSWKKNQGLFDSVGVDWLSRFVFDQLDKGQKEEYRQCFNYLIGIVSILLGLALLLL